MLLRDILLRRRWEFFRCRFGFFGCDRRICLWNFRLHKRRKSNLRRFTGALLCDRRQLLRSWLTSCDLLQSLSKVRYYLRIISRIFSLRLARIGALRRCSRTVLQGESLCFTFRWILPCTGVTSILIRCSRKRLSWHNASWRELISHEIKLTAKTRSGIFVVLIVRNTFWLFGP